jgi:hypothetical protein
MTIDPIPPTSGCPWPVDPACLGEEWDSLDDEVKDRATLLAGETLRRLTGYRVGGCPVTVRPCKRSCANVAYLPFYAGGYHPYINTAGYWVNSCGCHTDCSCSELCEITLPGPVGRVDTVKVDGIDIDPLDYRVDGNRLVWTGISDCPWPVCQNLALPDTEAGTFSVTYLNAWPVDTLGAYACGVMAYEYAQACIGNKCRLPANVTSLTRQGVSMEIETGAFPGGFTGIREVDAFIAIWNPDGLRQNTRVWSPDIRSPRVMR